MDTVFREATEPDVDAVLALQKTWDSEEITYGYEPNSREFVTEKLGASMFFVAEIDRRVVGFAFGTIKLSEGLAVTPAQERYMEVDDIYVAPASRRRGIGGRLLDLLLEAGKEAGVARVHVFSGTKDHDAVLRFYRDHGFRPWGVQLFR